MMTTGIPGHISDVIHFVLQTIEGLFHFTLDDHCPVAALACFYQNEVTHDPKSNATMSVFTAYWSRFAQCCLDQL